MSKREDNDPAPSIYEAAESPASETRGDGRLIQWITGFVLGVTCWMLIAMLGVPHIFGVDTLVGAIPFGIGGALTFGTRFRRWLVWICATLIAVAGIVAFTGIANRPARSLIRKDVIPASSDAIVVLSAGVTADGFVPQQGTDRLRKALELMRMGISPNLVVTRERRRIGNAYVSSAKDQNELVRLAGVQRFRSTAYARSTREEAVFVAAMARQLGWKHVVVVTSPFHSRRACGTFEKTGLLVSCIPADSRDISVLGLRLPGDRLGALGMWLYEMAGTMRYRERGWI